MIETIYKPAWGSLRKMAYQRGLVDFFFRDISKNRLDLTWPKASSRPFLLRETELRKLSSAR